MKKYLCMILCAIVIFFSFACGSGNNKTNDTPQETALITKAPSPEQTSHVTGKLETTEAACVKLSESLLMLIVKIYNPNNDLVVKNANGTVVVTNQDGKVVYNRQLGDCLIYPNQYGWLVETFQCEGIREEDSFTVFSEFYSFSDGDAVSPSDETLAHQSFTPLKVENVNLSEYKLFDEPIITFDLKNENDYTCSAYYIVLFRDEYGNITGAICGNANDLEPGASVSKQPDISGYSYVTKIFEIYTMPAF